MPRLSLWNNNKTNDYYFMDKNILEQFKIGGTGVLVHKYLGPSVGGVDDPSLPNYQAGSDDNPFGWVDETSIQDLTLMENRDRKYSDDVFELRGIYNVNDNDFDLTQFGLFLTQDTVFITFHINDMIETIGRKLLPGDVLELPHLLDETDLEVIGKPIPKFYVVQDGNRGSEGFSQTWRPHIWRVKMGPITDGQEFSDILGSNDQEDSLATVVSSYNKTLDINDKVKQAAEENSMIYDSPMASHIYDNTADTTYAFPASIPSGSTFPESPNQGDKFIRDDFFPRRLFERVGARWRKISDEDQSVDWYEKTFNAGGFVKDSLEETTVTSKTFAERQLISNPVPKLPENKDNE